MADQQASLPAETSTAIAPYVLEARAMTRRFGGLVEACGVDGVDLGPRDR